MLAGYFGSDVRLDAGFICGEMETRGTVDAVTIEQCHGRHFEICADLDDLLGQGRAFEETERGAGVKFGVQSSQLSAVSFQFSENLTTEALRHGERVKKKKSHEETPVLVSRELRKS